MKKPNVLFQQCVLDVLTVFKELKKGLNFTFEAPVGLEFLDIYMNVYDNHVCLMYRPHAHKEFVPFAFAHSRMVKKSDHICEFGISTKETSFLHCASQFWHASSLLHCSWLSTPFKLSSICRHIMKDDIHKYGCEKKPANFIGITA